MSIKSITLSFCVLTSAMLLSSVSFAGPLGCANAIKACIGGGKNVADSIKDSRGKCEALRDCKKVCRHDKRESKSEAKSDKKSCLKTCDNLKGKEKRSCKKSCKKTKRSDKRDARSTKRDCVQSCRDNYKTPQCKKARQQMIKTITVEGLKCGAKVSAQCGATAP
mgnify:CR=1 FL=1|jgi:hypothetical protein